ncbi:MAG: hypothetical protein LAT61_15050 [Alcanivorax sp.]|nr:hypothetical protein [Alcanivorax sp.]
MSVSTTFHVPLLVLCLTVLSGAAVANDGADPFEVLVISAVIGAQEDLDLRPCADSQCRVARGQDNLKRTLAEMERQRDLCRRVTDFTLVDEFTEYYLAGNERSPGATPQVYHARMATLSERLAAGFNGHPQSNLTCQSLVDTFAPASAGQASGPEYTRYIQEACQPLVLLRNCLIDHHRVGIRVYDDVSPRRGHWRTYEDRYKPR